MTGAAKDDAFFEALLDLYRMEYGIPEPFPAFRNLPKAPRTYVAGRQASKTLEVIGVNVAVSPYAPGDALFVMSTPVPVTMVPLFLVPPGVRDDPSYWSDDLYCRSVVWQEVRITNWRALIGCEETPAHPSAASLALAPPTDEELVTAYDNLVRECDGRRSLPDVVSVDHGAPVRRTFVTIGETLAARRRILAAKTIAADLVRMERARRMILGPVDDGDAVGAKDAASVLDEMARIGWRAR